MSPGVSKSTLRNVFAGLGLRSIALGGRFVFAIFATKYMLPDDFGRFGLLAGLALIIPTLVGLEAYQVLLRRIMQERGAAHVRRFYATFVLAGSLVTGLIGGLILVGFRWSATEVALGVVVLMLEHLGLETVRFLVVDQRPAMSVLSVAMRTGAWGVAVPALYFLRVISAPWSFETVLCAWIVGGIGAVLAGAPVWSRFRPYGRDINLRVGFGMVKEVASRSRNWIVFTGSLRVIETGGRFVSAWMISEAAAGRFTFLSMLASLNYIAHKGVVEPIYYPRLTAREVSHDTQREFLRITLVVIAGATVCSILGLAFSVWINGAGLPVSEIVSFGLLCLAFGCLCLTQPAHYRLYRFHQDRAIMQTGLAACIAMVVSSVIATKLWAMPGAAAGVLIGALVLLVSKNRAARNLAPDQPPDDHPENTP